MTGTNSYETLPKSQVRLLLPALPDGLRLRRRRDVLRARLEARVRAERGADRAGLPADVGRHVRGQHGVPPLHHVHVPHPAQLRRLVQRGPRARRPLHRHVLLPQLAFRCPSW